MTNRTYPINETAHAINGVQGRMGTIHTPQDVRGNMVHRNQRWVSEYRKVSGYGAGGEMCVEIRFDDECKNGHQSFAITASVYTAASRRRHDIEAGGCMHEAIAKVFPELAPFIKWHLTSTDGPMHYVANAMHFASDADCWGRRKGEASAWAHVVYFADSPVSHKIKGGFAKFLQSRMQDLGNGAFCAQPPELGSFQVVAIAHESRPGETYKFAPKFTFAGYGEKWHECPFDDEHMAQEWVQAFNLKKSVFKSVPTAFSEGKERELDKARRVAIWPEATDAELCADKETLKAALLARLPGLLAEFRTDVEKAGFLWEPETKETTE